MERDTGIDHGVSYPPSKEHTLASRGGGTADALTVTWEVSGGCEKACSDACSAGSSRLSSLALRPSPRLPTTGAWEIQTRKFLRAAYSRQSRPRLTRSIVSRSS